MSRRVFVLAGRIARQFLRDKRTLALIFVVPTVILTLLNYLISDEVTAVKAGVINNDKGVRIQVGASIPGELPGKARDALQSQGPAKTVGKEFGQQLLDLLNENENLDVVVKPEGKSWADDLEKGLVKGVVEIPSDFSEKIVRGEGVKLKLELEGSDPSLSGQVRKGVSEAVMALLEKQAGGKKLVDIEASFRHGGEKLDALDYFAPAFIGGFVFFFVFLLTSVSFLRERSQGTMERLAASPLTKLEIVLGYMTGFSIFALIQSLVVILFSIYVLGVNFAGSFGSILLVVFLLTLGSVNLGIFLSFFARTELQVVQFIPLVIMPQFLLGGLFWPVETMVKPLQWLAAVMPMKYSIEALREVMIKGSGLAEITAPVTFLAFFAALMVILAALNLKREA